MLRSKGLRRTLALLTAVLLVSPIRAQPAAEDPAGTGDALPRTGRLRGRVLTAERGKGLEDAVVFAYHLDTGAVFSSQPTDGKGRYRIDGLPLGWLDLYVETPDGLFVANQVVNMPPRGEIEVSLALTRFDAKPSSWWHGRRRDVPGVADAPAIGEARLDRTAKGRSFWKTPTGIALVAGGGALAILAVVAAGDDEPVASPSAP